MARDYHKQNVRPKQEFKRKSQQPTSEQVVSARQGLSIWWVMFFLVVVVLVTFLATKQMLKSEVNKPVVNPTAIATDKQDLNSERVDVEQAEPAVSQVDKVGVKPVVKEPVVEILTLKPAEKKVDFSFYHGLAETEVLVDVEPISIKLAVAYYIQAGTFGEERYALIEQKRLAKKGQNLDISVYTTKDRSYYRLRVGPFNDRLSMNKKRNELRRLGLDTLLVRAK